MIKILIADDHQMFLDGMQAFLERDVQIKVVGEALNGKEVIKLLKQSPIDIVVLDVEMPEMDGIETTKMIKKIFPDTKVLILTMYNKKDFILNLMSIGASGYILKNKSKEELLGAIHNIYKGKPHFGLEIIDTITSSEKVSMDTAQLTERELEVLCKIAEGFTTKQISDKLHIASTTVNTHRRNLLQKLDLPNDKHLVRYAIRHGMIDP